MFNVTPKIVDVESYLPGDPGQGVITDLGECIVWKDNNFTVGESCKALGIDLYTQTKAQFAVSPSQQIYLYADEPEDKHELMKIIYEVIPGAELNSVI